MVVYTFVNIASNCFLNKGLLLVKGFVSIVSINLGKFIKYERNIYFYAAIMRSYRSKLVWQFYIIH